jgi:arylsulfatase A-like enzyme
MSPRRNLLIVLAHGLRADALGSAGAWPLRTPCIESLGQRSLCLVATSASPSDPAGMVSLLTGLHPRQLGCWDTPGTAVSTLGWPALLKDSGYFLAGVGCVGMIQPLLDRSVLVQPPVAPEAQAGPCAYMLHSAAGNRHEQILEQRRRRQRVGPFDPMRLALEPDDDIDGFIAVRARQTLAMMPKDKPWALIVMFSGPANDLPPPLLYDGLLDRATLSDGFLPADFSKLDALAELDFPRSMIQRLDRKLIAQVRGDYLERVALMDQGLGRLTQELAQRSDADRTWMVLSSDRGCLLGEHGLVGHRSFLAGAIEVPVIVSPPTPAPQQAIDGLVATVDVAATISDLAGIDLTRGAVGCSLLPVLRGAPFLSTLGGCCVSEFGHRLMLETDRHKVVFDTPSRQALGLYDMLYDFEERENLLDHPRGRDLLDSLRWRLGDALMPLRAG